eukprot:403354298
MSSDYQKQKTSPQRLKQDTSPISSLKTKQFIKNSQKTGNSTTSHKQSKNLSNNNNGNSHQRSNSSIYENNYLLKLNQVPINEFLKLRINFDKQLEQAKIEKQTKAVSQKRYQELTQQYTCTNNDPRLVIKPPDLSIQIGGNSSFQNTNKTKNQGKNSYNAANELLDQLNVELQKYTFSGQGHSPKRRPIKKKSLKFQDENSNPAAALTVLQPLVKEQPQHSEMEPSPHKQKSNVSLFNRSDLKSRGDQGSVKSGKNSLISPVQHQSSVFKFNNMSQTGLVNKSVVFNNKNLNQSNLSSQSKPSTSQNKNRLYPQQSQQQDDILSQLDINDRDERIYSPDKISSSQLQRGDNQFFGKRNQNQQLSTHSNHQDCLIPKDPDNPIMPIFSSPIKHINNQDILLHQSLVADDFLATGLGKKFSKLQYYNSLKYPKQSPRGLEVRMLSANPDILSREGNNYILEQRRKLSFKMKRLNESVNKNPLSDEFVIYENHSSSKLPQDQVESQVFFKNPKISLLNQGKVLFSPTIGKKGKFKIFKETDYENWFKQKLRKMKDVSILKYQCMDSKIKNYDEMRNFCNSRRGSNNSQSNKKQYPISMPSSPIRIQNL